MGKVGSTSIYYSLKKKYKGQVLFIHRMIQENIDAYNEAFIRKGLKPHNAKIGKLMYGKMSSKMIKIITLVREPIGRNISDFFQDLKVYMDDHSKIESYDDEMIRSQFLNNYPHEIPLYWFTDEFQRTTKINIYEYPFDIKKKYTVINNGAIEVLIMRVDLEDDRKEQLVKDFLGLNELEIKRYNSANDKFYHDRYRSFLMNSKFEDVFVHKMIDSEYCKHFYSKDEIEQFRTLYAI
jgi:hypothetical protein